MTKSTKKGVRVNVNIDGVNTQFQPDSGSDVNVFGYNDFKAFSHHAGWTPRLKPVKSKITAANGTDMDFTGHFEATFTSKKSRKKYKIYVQRQANKDPPLLCETALLELGYIQYSVNGEFEPIISENTSEMDTKVLSTKKVPTILPITTDTRQQEIDNEFPDVYTGIGKLKGFQATLYMKEGEPGFYQKALHVPVYLQENAEKRLDFFEEQEIMLLTVSATKAWKTRGGEASGQL
jgi:hypothetical protein